MPSRPPSDLHLGACASRRHRLDQRLCWGRHPSAWNRVLRRAGLPPIEADIRRLRPDDRFAVRRERSAPALARIKDCHDHHRSRVSPKAPLGEALSYIAKHGGGLELFLTDGRI
ncbi:IS66 family transposase [Pelagibacterium flavum]|uniref:IS66 family transposase n=1 Tax=Pelagibacterium flavum TaxID=2984530 RepID=UPI0038CD45C7